MSFEMNKLANYPFEQLPDSKSHEDCKGAMDTKPKVKEK